MKTSTFFILSLLITYCYIAAAAAAADEQDEFLECLHDEFENFTAISSHVYTPTNSSYPSILRFSIRNLRYATNSTPKPLLILTPDQESQIPPIIHCAVQSDLQIRTRSGGHDAEGLSYVSKVPFMILDLINLSQISINVEEKTAWIGGGATIGSLYYKIAEKSPTLGFPAGFCPTLGVGGHISGGGYGFMMRKHGLAADNIVDARIVDVHGRILDREAMGEDLFWAIRGGVGASFGVITAWKVQLVDVPEKITTCTTQRTLEQNATYLVHRWQHVAPRIDDDLFIWLTAARVNSSDGTTTILSSFFSFYLGGGADKLAALMHERFPELGFSRQDCTEMTWIETTVLTAILSGYPNATIESLLSRSQPNLMSLKIKSDYVKSPIPIHGLKMMWRLLSGPEGERGRLIFTPYGGRMAEIPESSIPFPHRAGNLFKLTSVLYWAEGEADEADRFMGWSRRFYSSMTPYVSRNPREAYVNYRDLDLGVNNARGMTTYEEASVWGFKYFKGNFDRLVRVKTAVDPRNFFRNEQSIPAVYSDTDD
ncbi:tetrahydroberberine oxidase-like [Andrographis paniculata]|uniref:tetrahydroberberine oxidase-like n=1 Tax=Andrographis paniculata TaxID=175694 RepID=UPI0021E7391E|nr:tetrahydroberberine oxidase-like [Andrographis paniculata]